MFLITNAITSICSVLYIYLAHEYGPCGWKQGDIFMLLM